MTLNTLVTVRGARLISEERPVVRSETLANYTPIGAGGLRVDFVGPQKLTAPFWDGPISELPDLFGWSMMDMPIVDFLGSVDGNSFQPTTVNAILAARSIWWSAEDSAGRAIANPIDLETTNNGILWIVGNDGKGLLQFRIDTGFTGAGGFGGFFAASVTAVSQALAVDIALGAGGLRLGFGGQVEQLTGPAMNKRVWASISEIGAGLGLISIGGDVAPTNRQEAECVIRYDPDLVAGRSVVDDKLRRWLVSGSRIDDAAGRIVYSIYRDTASG